MAKASRGSSPAKTQEPEQKPEVKHSEAKVETNEAASKLLLRYNPETHYLVERTGFNHMIATLLNGNPGGLQNFTRLALVSKIGEMCGLDRADPGFYAKATDLVQTMNKEHWSKNA